MFGHDSFSVLVFDLKGDAFLKIIHTLSESELIKEVIFVGPLLGGGGRKDQRTKTLCQSDRHFLEFSGTTRNERHRKSN